MFVLTSVEPLFSGEGAVPEDTLKKAVVDHFKMVHLPGVPEHKLEISFNPEDGGDILIKQIDPHAASGYLVFQDETAYNDWLNAQLYEPSQEDMAEAAQRGAGS